jgi:hypothetical protein
MNQQEFESRIIGLKPKYQEQFRKIYESNENFKGDFNLMAFLFGIFWCLTKGLWLVSIIVILIAYYSSGIGAIFFWLYFGIRGNYIYYKYFIDNKQVIF